jgi:ABC transporter with metal-binding/Fe-S-binding domain ATP-binding protein
VRLAALFSGGKDSTFAIYKAREAGHEVACLITMHPAGDDSALFHYPNSRVTKHLAQAMGIPVLDFEIAGSSKEAESEALAQAVAKAKSVYNIEGLLSGGIASVFQKTAFEQACKEHGIKPLAPLWGAEPEKYMNELLDNGFSIMIVGVSAMGLDKEWLGRIIDKEALVRLAQLSKKHGFNLTFEGGEAETLVLDCPLYSKKLKITRSRTRWDGQRGMFEILEAELVQK